MNSNSILNDFKQIFRSNDNAVLQIILINIVVFLAVNLIRLVTFLFGLSENILDETLKWLAVPADFHSLIFRPWTVVTYMFLHEGILHILFNMLWFYWFGNILREYIGNKKIFPIYLLGGIFGAALYILSFNIFPVFRNVIDGSFAMGASAGVLAIVVATAVLLPDYQLFLLFFGAIKLKYIAIVSILLDLVSIPQGNAGGHIAHLGGALFGFLFIKQLQRGNDWSIGVNYFFDFVKNIFLIKSKPKIVHRQTSAFTKKSPAKKSISAEKQAKIDAILDKIAQSGYENLSTDEKAFLFNASNDPD